MNSALHFSLINSAPPLSLDALTRAEASLAQHHNLTPLPQSYRQFLLANNGGWVSPGAVDSDSGEHTHAVVFDTPLVWARDNDRPVSPELVFFFFAYDATTMRDAMAEKSDPSLYELVASNRYSKEDYDVLPPGMMSFAKAQRPEAADMLCISLSKADYGAVYYHYGMWHYPFRPHGDFYERRRSDLLAPFGSAADAALNDEDHPQHAAVNEALRYVPFVRVGDSFEDWLSRLRVVRTA
jgi:SMI1 / KNR4 family (SUKH-1)